MADPSKEMISAEVSERITSGLDEMTDVEAHEAFSERLESFLEEKGLDESDIISGQSEYASAIQEEVFPRLDFSGMEGTGLSLADVRLMREGKEYRLEMAEEYLTGNAEESIEDKSSQAYEEAVATKEFMHYELRDAFNTLKGPPPATLEDFNNDPKRLAWDKMPKDQAAFHQNEDEIEDLKFIHPEDGREVVYDGDTKELMTADNGNAEFMGTYNYVNATIPDDKTPGIRETLENIGTERSLLHKTYDVLPWAEMGNTRAEGEEFGGELSRNLQLLDALGKGTVNSAGNDLDDAGGWVADKAGQVRDAASEKIDQAGEVLSDTGDAIAETAGDVRDAVSEKIDQAGEVLSDAGEYIAETAGDVRDAVSEKIDQAGEVLSDAGEAIAETAGDVRDAASEKIDQAGEVLSDAGEAIAETAGDVRDAVSEKMDQAGEAINDTYEDAKGIGRGWMKDAREAFDNLTGRSDDRESTDAVEPENAAPTHGSGGATGSWQEGALNPGEQTMNGAHVQEASLSETAMPTDAGTIRLEDAIGMLTADQKALNTANTGEEASSVQEAVNHPDAAQMYKNLHTHGVETVPAEITPEMGAEDRVRELLLAGQEATKEAGIPMPAEQRELDAAQELNNSYQQQLNNSYEDDYSLGI